MKKIIVLFAAFTLFACSTPRNNGETTDEEIADGMEQDEGVIFANITDGATLSSPFALDMGVNGMQVEPKGTPRAGFGHHHLLINDVFTPAGTVIVADDTHIHYGGGQTSDSISLEPGVYQLTLQFADGMHVSYGQDWSSSISVTVE
ncbi:MAG: rod shape-determining protein RodA [Bacteroidetes bacterium]|nr:MAG: rod shape-determining protein RodA [Bacteroidota bacterium]